MRVGTRTSYTVLCTALLLAVLLGRPTDASAQIAIELSDIQDQIGVVLDVETFEVVDPTGLQALVDASGENQTWDFTTVNFESVESGSYEIMPLPADVPGASDPAFANATHVTAIATTGETAEEDSTAWTFVTIDETGILTHGLVFLADLDEDGVATDEVKLIIDPPFLTQPLPLTFETAWSDTSSMVVELAGVQLTGEISVDAVVDGYGTLITPAGEAPALRIRSTDVQTIAGIGVADTSVTYEFVTEGELSATLEVDDDGNVILASYTVTQAAGTAIERVGTEIPEGYSLEQNYPNPFNPSTTIHYELPEMQQVRLSIYDVLGREVAVLVDAPQAAGQYAVTFDAEDLPSGVYLYRLEAGSFSQTRAMHLEK